MKPQLELIYPDWPCATNVRACVTTRNGGYSQAPFDSLNVGDHVEDIAETVAKNRDLLKQQAPLPQDPLWLTQTHETHVVDAARCLPGTSADAAFTSDKNTVCAVMTADCLPVFFAARDGSEVAVAHAGWRGLAAGILDATINSLDTNATDIICWLGPAIGVNAFEVGEEVQAAFVEQNDLFKAGFISAKQGHWMADIYMLASIKLKLAGITQISGGNFCTYEEKDRFFSYRRDGKTGRMASLIWISD